MAKDIDTSRGPRRGCRALAVLLAGALAGGIFFGGVDARASEPALFDPVCSVPASALSMGADLPAVVAALRRGGDVEIVALGSSSTEGAGATSPDKAYPAQLAEELRQRFPNSTITVVNRGIGGQLARQMVERLSRDAIEAKPELVIWQTGTNDALALIDQDDFRGTLVGGIDRLKAAGIDVLLMDLQFYPRSSKSDTYERYVDTMSAVAKSEKVGLFGRYAMMRHWAAADLGLWSGDNFHLGNLGYHCVAEVLAEAIQLQVHGIQQAQAAVSAPVVTAAQ